MTIGKRETAGATMVITRKIRVPLRSVWRIGPASHINEKIPQVDRVFALVPEQGRHRWAGIDQVPQPPVQTPGRAADAGQDVKVTPGTAEPNAHRHAANAAHRAASEWTARRDNRRRISRAFEDA